MNDQIGWRGLISRLKNEAPRFVQLLPELPRLLHQSLQPKPVAEQRTLEALLAEQRRTNRLLQAIVYAGLGFLIGVLVVQWFMHVGYR